MSSTHQSFASMDLISAASLGAYNSVDEILKNNLSDVNAVNQNGWTALMYAANYGHFHIIRLLMKHKCDPNYQDSQGRSALMLAASNGHTRSIDALINYGKADRNLKDYSGLDAFSHAKSNGHGNNKLIKNLLLQAKEHDGYEVRGRAYSMQTHAAIVEPTQSSPSIQQSLSAESIQQCNLYNPCEPTAFSSALSSVWRPIRSQTYGHNKSKEAFNQVISCVQSSIQELTPSDSSSSAGSELSSSQSSGHSSVISAPANFRRKTMGDRKKSPKVVSITGPVPNTLFQLLTRIELIQYLDVFESNSIDFYQFLTLSDEDFVKLGITSYGHRKKMSTAQKRYHESLDISCTQESFLADFLLNERHLLREQIRTLESKVKNLEKSPQN